MCNNEYTGRQSAELASNTWLTQHVLSFEMSQSQNTNKTQKSKTATCNVFGQWFSTSGSGLLRGSQDNFWG